MVIFAAHCQPRAVEKIIHKGLQIFLHTYTFIYTPQLTPLSLLMYLKVVANCSFHFKMDRAPLKHERSFKNVKVRGRWRVLRAGWRAGPQVGIGVDVVVPAGCCWVVSESDPIHPVHCTDRC